MSVEQEIAQRLMARGLTLAVAEACTSGRLGHLLTRVSGSSAYFYGGVLAYAQSIKTDVLGIPLELLKAEGAVSENTALAMAQRVRELCNTSIGISTTGIAGPNGGTTQKPVGLFYVALSTQNSHQLCRRFLFANSGREPNREQAAQEALALLQEYLSWLA